MIRKIKIVPALLTDDFRSFKKMIERAETFADFIQIDIMDGVFVPSKSIAASDLAKISVKAKWEAHLMVVHPLKQLIDFKKAGASRVIFHYECSDLPMEVISETRNIGLKVGLAINPETPVNKFLKLVSEVDSLLFLTVNPGFYGSPFVPEALAKVKETRGEYSGVEIGVDGGIKADNLLRVAETGVDYICVGSAIMMQPDPKLAYQNLVSELRDYQSNK